MKEDDVVQLAKAILSNKLKSSSVIKDFSACRDYIVMEFADCPREMLGVMFLDLNRRIVSFEKMNFDGLVQIETCLRKIVKNAIFYDTDAVIIAHNFQYQNELEFFKALRSNLKGVDISIVDYIVVVNGEAESLVCS